MLSGKQGEEAQEAALKHLIEVMVVMAFAQIRLVPDVTLMAQHNSIYRPS